MIVFNVKTVLKNRNMTQMELVRKTGIRQPTISAICLGTAKHIPVEVLDKMCAVLECQPADLMEFVADTEAAGGVQ